MNDTTAEIIGFPLERRINLVRQTAAELFSLNGEDANGYWRATARKQLEMLTRQGRSMEAARKEVLHFFEAVQIEFRREASVRRESVTA